MTACLARRGPDGAGVWCAGAVGLGHRMLGSTPGSARETQPLVDASGTLVITADARIDNRAELSSLLGLGAAATAAAEDSELILAAYRAWGVACPARLRRRLCVRHLGRQPAAPLLRARSPWRQAVLLPRVSRCVRLRVRRRGGPPSSAGAVSDRRGPDRRLSREPARGHRQGIDLLSGRAADAPRPHHERVAGRDRFTGVLDAGRHVGAPLRIG